MVQFFFDSIVGKGEILVTSIFSFFHNVFKRFLSHGHCAVMVTHPWAICKTCLFSWKPLSIFLTNSSVESKMVSAINTTHFNGHVIIDS